MIVTCGPDGEQELHPERPEEHPEFDGEYEDEGGRFANAEDGVSSLVAAILNEMEDSGSSETMGVADILRTIASNGEGQEADDFLVGCAQEIIEAAQYFIDRVQAGDTSPGSSREKLLVIKEMELVAKAPYDTWILVFVCPQDNQPGQLMADLTEAGWTTKTTLPLPGGEIKINISRPGRGLFGGWLPHEAAINLAQLEAILKEYGLGLPPKRNLKMQDVI
ncbi:MAG: hypothetical protein KJ077_10855 [Anaerolineae bacterium]|nr:hypothetical protein [Anaerolineae bacterium]